MSPPRAKPLTKPLQERIPQRRSLEFSKFHEVLADVQAMSACQHSCAGNWTLAQVCKHLASTFHASIDGIAMSGPRWRRVLLGRMILAWSIKHGLPPGITVDARLNPPSQCDLEPAMADLRQAIERYEAHRSALRPHPIFGRLNRRDWDRLHLFHCAHHLSFIVP